jgi:thymidylate synthase
MRIYKDALEMIKEVERDLYEMGINYQSYSVQDQIVKDDPNFLTKEIVGYTYKVMPNERGYFENMYEMANYKKEREYFNWIEAESIERLGGIAQNPGNAWKNRRKFWEQFIRRGRFSYSYVERWSEQLPYIISELQDSPNSRQVVMTMYDRHQDLMNWGGLDRVPCSLDYHFLRRQGKLYLIYNQRSCDFVNFFQADVYCTMRLQMYIAGIIGDEIGTFIHNINSLHAFAKDLEGVF